MACPSRSRITTGTSTRFTPVLKVNGASRWVTSAAGCVCCAGQVITVQAQTAIISLELARKCTDRFYISLFNRAGGSAGARLPRALAKRRMKEVTKEEGILEETRAVALKETLAWQVQQATEKEKISKAEMARAAQGVGHDLRIELV